MRTQDFNLSNINQSVLDIYVKPSNDRHLDDDDFKLSSINLTWSA